MYLFSTNLATAALFVGFFTICVAVRTKEKIYVDVEGYHACFRHLNATHQMGCSTGRKGNVGIIHYLENQTDVDWVVNVGPHDPYIVLLKPWMFTRSVVEQLASSNKINGILVIHTNDTDYPAEFSSDSTCPNEHLDLYSSDPDYAHCKNVTWNPNGNSLFHEDHQFPIMVLTNQTEVEDLIENCYKKHNEPKSDGTLRQYPLCAAEIKDAMDGAVDTPTCIRRSNMVTNLNPQTYCDPLGDYNVYGFMQQVSTEAMDNKSLIIAATRMDSFSMFQSLYPSANNPISSLVTLLAAAEALGRFKDDFAQPSKPLMFAFLNGEAFDYIGSSRLLYDMEQEYFPFGTRDKDNNKDEHGPAAVTPEKIHTFYEVSQVGSNGSYRFFMHTDPVSRRSAEVESDVTNLLANISSIASDVNVDIVAVPTVQPLPPASFQTFLKKRNISGVVIADHETAYINQYYNSMYDLPATISASYPSYPDNITDDEKYNYVTAAAGNLTKLATVIARALYEQSTGRNSSHIQANETIMANLLYCFTYSPICELFNYTLNPTDSAHITSDSLNFYVGVSSYTVNWVTQVTRHLLSYFLGDRVTLTPDTCSEFKDDGTRYEKCCEELTAHKDDKFYKYLYINGAVDHSSEEYKREGVCIKSVVDDIMAKSPAFEIDGYTWETNDYSAWTESRWATDAIFVRYFLVPPLDKEITLLLCSMALMGFSLLVAYFVEKKSNVLFAFPSRLLINDASSDVSDMTLYGTNTPTQQNNNSNNQVRPVNL